MIEDLTIEDQKLQEHNIEQILVRAVNLFRKTGLSDLANKWERILNTYASKKALNTN
jgi:hypothetical protein